MKLSQDIIPKKPKSPIPIPPPKSDLETSYYNYIAWAALHSAGIHIHFNRE